MDQRSYFVSAAGNRQWQAGPFKECLTKRGGFEPMMLLRLKLRVTPTALPGARHRRKSKQEMHG